MNTAVKFLEAGDVSCMSFDLPAAFWQEIMNDNVSLLADDGGFVTIFSFATGAELARAQVEPQLLCRFSEAALPVLNRSGVPAGEAAEETAIFKLEQFDCTGHLAAGIRNQATGDIASAITHYQIAINSNSSLARALNLLGLCRRINGDVDEAEACYRKSIAAATDAPEAYCNLGILYQKTGREDEAQQLFQQALHCDQFYFNALLRRAGWFLETGQINNPLLSELNLRLLMHYSEIGAVQRHLLKSADRSDMLLEEYSEKLHNENGAMASSKIQKLQRQIETLVVNGAYAAAIEHMQLLSSMTPQTQAEKNISTWCCLRADRIRGKISDQNGFAFLKTLGTLFKPSGSEARRSEEKNSPLSVAEFFSLVLLEVMRDGQIEPAERDLLQRLRIALNIGEDSYITMFNNVRRQLAGIEVSGGLREKFSHQRLFKNLCLAAFRDGIVEDSEKKILGFACKAFGISSEEFKRIIAEVPK